MVYVIIFIRYDALPILVNKKLICKSAMTQFFISSQTTFYLDTIMKRSIKYCLHILFLIFLMCGYVVTDYCPQFSGLKDYDLTTRKGKIF